MTRETSSPYPATGLALACAGTVWVTMLAWQPFTEAWPAALVPLLGLGLVVALVGSVARRARLPLVVVVGLQVVLGSAAACLMLTGSPVPVGGAAEELSRAFAAAVDSSTLYAAPVPASAPGIHPLLIAGGLGALLVVDVLACSLRRVSLTGLPILAVSSVPVSVLGTGLSWWVFVLSAAGFLTMLYLDEGETLTRWGRALRGDDDPSTSGLDVRTGTARGGAGAVGTVAVALALAVPLVLPTLHLQVFDVGPGTGAGGEIEVDNPMVDLRRDLRRGEDVPLVTVSTDDPAPAYLRISVLNDFTDDEWTAGNRSIPVEQKPTGPMPALQGLSGRVPVTSYAYRLRAADAFASTWLPTQAPVSRVFAAGDWRYDEDTMDFIAAGDGVTTAGLDWEETAVVPDLDPRDLAAARSASSDVDSTYVDLPTDLPEVVSSLAASVTAQESSDFEKAVALQQWFREDGGFTYSLSRSEVGNGVDALTAFLTEGDGGRVGYCEQFAAAMAVMARDLGIPARVAVGFLEPDLQEDGTWIYSSHDLHAWPELYFPGAGWTRFEPTPARRASGVPAYTQEQQAPVAPELPGGGPSAQPSAAPDDPRLDRATEPAAPEVGDTVPTSDPGGSRGWVLGSGAGVLLMLGLLLVPGVVRRRRREQRLAGTPETCWREVRDTVVDLGLTWPGQRSPQQVAEVLGRYLHDPQAQAALAVLVGEVERTRYARRHAPAETGPSARLVVTALESSAGTRHRRRARWLPVTVLRRRGPEARARGRRVATEVSTAGAGLAEPRS